MNDEEAGVNLNYEDEDDTRHINENGKSDYVTGSQWRLGLEEAP